MAQGVASCLYVQEQEQFEATLYLSPVSDSGTPGTASGTPDNTASDPGSIDKGTGPEPVTMEDVTGGDRSGGSSSDEQSAALLYVVVGAVVAVLLAAVALMLALHKRRKRRRRAAHKAASSAAAAAYMSKPPGSQPVRIFCPLSTAHSWKYCKVSGCTRTESPTDCLHKLS